MINRLAGFLAFSALFAITGCASDSPTGPRDRPAVALDAIAASSAAATLPSGERLVGRVAVEPASNAETGSLLHLLTPEKAPFPSKANAHAISPLYLVEYPPGSTVVPGHDHIVDPPGGEDWNVAWQVIEVLFTNAQAANSHLTTEAQIEQAVANGDAIEIDPGFAFNCSAVPAAVYWRGTPVS